MPATLSLAVWIDGAVVASDPAAALLELTRPLGRRLLAYMDQVRQLQAGDPELLSVDRAGYHLTWLVDLESFPAEAELQGTDWTLLDSDQVAGIRTALQQNPRRLARIDAPVLVCEPDRVSWRCCPKHGDEIFTTPDLRRVSLVDLFAELD